MPLFRSPSPKLPSRPSDGTLRATFLRVGALLSAKRYIFDVSNMRIENGVGVDEKMSDRSGARRWSNSGVRGGGAGLCLLFGAGPAIGRASGRERVCQYV